MVLEIYVTPDDDINATEQEGSEATDLEAGNVVGFQIAMPDFDTAPQAYRGYRGCRLVVGADQGEFQRLKLSLLHLL